MLPSKVRKNYYELLWFAFPDKIHEYLPHTSPKSSRHSPFIKTKQLLAVYNRDSSRGLGKRKKMLLDYVGSEKI